MIETSMEFEATHVRTFNEECRIGVTAYAKGIRTFPGGGITVWKSMKLRTLRELKV